MAKNSNDPFVIRIADLSKTRDHPFSLAPDADIRAAIAEELSIPQLRKLRFEGELQPKSRNDWVLNARLGATVVQHCVITLDPVTTRIEEQVHRTYLADLPDSEPGEEQEIPEDDSIEALPAEIDLRALICESLALALPAYPQVEGASLGSLSVTEPGKTPLSDADTKPFAGLADLRAKLSGDDPD